MPIFVLDTESGARGLLHSGWKGTGILQTAVETMHEVYHSDPRNLIVLLGPCISAANYEVDAARAEVFGDEFGEQSVDKHKGRYFLDLRAANEEICRRCRIRRVSTVDECTYGNTSLGSYRREGADSYTLMMAMFGDSWEME